MLILDLCCWCDAELGIIDVVVPDCVEVQEGDAIRGGMCPNCHTKILSEIKRDA